MSDTTQAHITPQESRIAPLFPRQAQISSILSIPLCRRKRYQVMLGERILGDRLSLEQANKLAGGGEG